MVVLTEDCPGSNAEQRRHFNFHYDPWRLKLVRLVPGAFRGNGVDVVPEAVRLSPVSRGPLVIPSDSITRIWRPKVPSPRFTTRLLWGLGLCGHDEGVVWLNTSWDNLVAFEIDPPVDARRWGRSTKAHTVIVSVKDPDGLVAELLG